ncbi:MAG: hypothetical protein KCHDKBKB_02595 [Elusimicrobia bacterium]|nr:hypothetical protein [Elusimicrobiota bacterium]
MFSGRTDTLIYIMPVRTDQDHCGTVRDPGFLHGENLGPGQKIAGATAPCVVPLGTIQLNHSSFSGGTL